MTICVTPMVAAEQVWMLSKIGEIRRDESCFDYSGASVVIYPCHGQKGNQQWDYRPVRLELMMIWSH